MPDKAHCSTRRTRRAKPSPVPRSLSAERLQADIFAKRRPDLRRAGQFPTKTPIEGAVVAVLAAIRHTDLRSPRQWASTNPRTTLIPDCRPPTPRAWTPGPSTLRSNCADRFTQTPTDFASATTALSSFTIRLLV
jgi:hypothetical protein